MSFLSLHKRISKDKKAGISTAPTTIIGLIVAVIVILGTFVVFAALLGMFTGSADQQTELFYDNFVHGVIALEDSSIPIGGACWVSGSLHEDWALIMFDAAGSGAYDQCGSDDWVNKPNGCGGNRPTELGCVCICYGGVGDVGGDDDCNEHSPKCFKTSVFKRFAYPSHNYYDDDEYGWLCKDKFMDLSCWNYNDRGDDDHMFYYGWIYNKGCGGSVWNTGVNNYVLRKVDAESLIVKRAPLDVSQLGIERCSELYDKQQQSRGGMETVQRQ